MLIAACVFLQAFHDVPDQQRPYGSPQKPPNFPSKGRKATRMPHFSTLFGMISIAIPTQALSHFVRPLFLLCSKGPHHKGRLAFLAFVLYGHSVPPTGPRNAGLLMLGVAHGGMERTRGTLGP